MSRWFIVTMLFAAVATFAGCSDDVETADLDAKYQIQYYHEPPYANVEQGYWYDNRFIKLIPAAKPPYTLMVIPRNENGVEALKAMQSQKKIQIVNGSEQQGVGSQTLVNSDYYFESPNFYVSSFYSVAEYGVESVDYCRIVPMMIVCMKAGADVSDIQEKYKDVMTLSDRKSSVGKVSDKPIYYFDCRVNNSCEVLQLASELYQRDDVDWAEPDMYTSIHFGM